MIDSISVGQGKLEKLIQNMDWNKWHKGEYLFIDNIKYMGLKFAQLSKTQKETVAYLFEKLSRS